MSAGHLNSDVYFLDVIDSSGGRGQCEHNTAGLLFWEEWK